MLKLTLKFEVTINEIVGSRKLSEVKTYSITDEFNETVGIKEIIDSSKKVIESKITNTEAASDVVVTCIGIIPVEETVVEPAKIDEPVKTESTDAFDGAMNPPEEVPQNVVEEIPEGFKEMEEVEESPFTNTYYDNDSDVGTDTIQEPEGEAYNEEEMFEKFLKLSFLTRQNLLIKEFSLLPEEHRGERHKVAYPIAVKVAKERGILKDFYDAILKNSQ